MSNLLLIIVPEMLRGEMWNSYDISYAVQLLPQKYHMLFNCLVLLAILASQNILTYHSGHLYAYEM